MNISDNLHKTVLELVEVLKKTGQDEPVELNDSLKLVKECIDEKKRKEDIARQCLLPIIKFLDETGDMIMSPTKKFRDFVSIDSDRAYISIKHGNRPYTSIEIWGLYSDDSKSGELYYNCAPKSATEIIEKIVKWLVDCGAKLPKGI